MNYLNDRIVALEEELAAAARREQRLQAALAFWMPGVTPEIEEELHGRAGDDAELLFGFEGEVPTPSWGDTVLARLSADHTKLTRSGHLRFGAYVWAAFGILSWLTPTPEAYTAMFIIIAAVSSVGAEILRAAQR